MLCPGVWLSHQHFDIYKHFFQVGDQAWPVTLYPNEIKYHIQRNDTTSIINKWLKLFPIYK